MTAKAPPVISSSRGNVQSRERIILASFWQENIPIVPPVERCSLFDSLSSLIKCPDLRHTLARSGTTMTDLNNQGLSLQTWTRSAFW